MQTTKADLAPATIENLSTGFIVRCMFNPNEYTLSKQNQWHEGEQKNSNVPKMKFTQGGSKSLKLQLFFDTYAEKIDVRTHTQGLWDMMLTTEIEKNPKSDKSRPPFVAFHWGSFYFKAVITNLSQKFTLFGREGIPLRTTVDVSFLQVEDDERFPKQNPTSGGGAALRTYIVKLGDRLDFVAAQMYGNPTHWRLIAKENKLIHPLQLRKGQQLVIPPLE